MIPIKQPGIAKIHRPRKIICLVHGQSEYIDVT